MGDLELFRLQRQVDPVGDLELSRLQRQMVTPVDIATLDMQLNHFVKTLGVKSEYNSYTLGTGKPYSEILKIQKMTQAGLIMMAAHSHT